MFLTTRDLLRAPVIVRNICAAGRPGPDQPLALTAEPAPHHRRENHTLLTPPRSSPREQLTSKPHDAAECPTRPLNLAALVNRQPTTSFTRGRGSTPPEHSCESTEPTQPLPTEQYFKPSNAWLSCGGRMSPLNQPRTSRPPAAAAGCYAAADSGVCFQGHPHHGRHFGFGWYPHKFLTVPTGHDVRAHLERRLRDRPERDAHLVHRQPLHTT